MSGNAVVLATDLSESSEPATMEAMTLASRLGAKLVIVHAWQLPVYAVPDGVAVFGPEVASELDNALQKRIDALAGRLREGGLVVEPRLVAGATVESILEVAREVGASYLVIGTHGRTGVQRVLMGSVAERLVRTSTLPVLVVPSKS